ncbi:Nn.00g030890.m01.CDS01 [Neocucurbitaria sp. VM-36]
MYDMGVMMARRKGLGRFQNTYPSWDLPNYSAYTNYSGLLDPSYFGYGYELDTPNSVEEATRAHVEAQKEWEKLKEKYDEAKKKLEDSEKKVKEAEERLSWAKNRGRYS